MSTRGRRRIKVLFVYFHTDSNLDLIVRNKGVRNAEIAA